MSEMNTAVLGPSTLEIPFSPFNLETLTQNNITIQQFIIKLLLHKARYGYPCGSSVQTCD